MIFKDFNVIIEKTENLCTLLLEQEAYKELRQMIEQFTVDEESNKQYERFVGKEQLRRQKLQQDLALTPEEYDDFNQEERALYENSVIRKYLYARKELDHLQHLIHQYLTKTIDLGRIPRPNEIDKISRGCGSAY